MAERRRPTVAIVVPVYMEPEIDKQMERLCTLGADELIVVEAGDAVTGARLRAFLDTRDGGASPMRALRAFRGRASQMNAGAQVTHADILLFLHADTGLPSAALDLVRDAIACGEIWGRFDVRLSGQAVAFRLIERLMNLRSALTGIATGDQAMFVRRDAFNLLGGFAPIALMEDIELSTRLKWIARPHCIRTPVVTSSRRWEQRGIVHTVALMWLLRGLYALGVPPARLARWYK